MTIQIVITNSRVEAAPGDILGLPIRLTNTADVAAICRVRLVGLDEESGATGSDGAIESPPSEFVVPPGATIEVLSPVPVPWVLGIGDHTAAIEVTSDRPGDRPVLAPFVISIGSVARVELTPLPATMRGRRRAKFKLDVVNHEPVPVDLVISAEAQDVDVRFSVPAMRLQPGERGLSSARVRGPRHWSGEATQHNLVITATGRASSTSTTAAYIQRPWFAHRARMALAGLTVVALWLGAIGGVALWWSNRAEDQVADDATEFTVVGVDTDGDGIKDTFTYTDADGNVITGIDIDGDGVPDQFTDAAGNPVDDPTAGGGTGESGGDSGGSDGSGESGGSGGGDSGGGSDGSDGSGEEEPTGPTSALVRGTVKAEGDPSDITITLAPIALGTTPEPAAIQGFVGPPPPEAAKIWSARAVPPGSATLNPIRQTEPLAPQQTTPEADGVWQFPNVELRRSYQIVFAKPGFDTQSFVVTPPDDGSALDLDVELVPANGMIGGTVRGPSGALGGAEIVVTDGILTFTTTSATVGDVGSWSIEQVSTPGVYTVSATLRGYGTEVRQVRLEAGAAFPNADLTMKVGVGSISGRVVGPDGQPIGGVSITATNGDESRTTSSLTEGDVGSYNIPQLSVGGTFTLAVSAPGYLPESRRTPVNGPVGGVNFGLTKTTLTLTGTITSGTTGIGIANAGLTLTTGDLTFRAVTAGGASRGTFAIADLPPGSYTVTVDHYQHVPATQLVVLTAGVTPPPLDIALERGTGLPALGRGSLVVEVVDPSAKTAETRQVKNATVRLIRTQTGEELPPTTQEAFNFRIENIPIGTYTLIVTAPKYNPAPPRQVSIGLAEERTEVQMFRLGQASGYVVDSLTKAKLTNYFVNIYRLPESPGDSPIFVIQGDTTTGLWQTPPDSLVPGTYRIDIPDSSSPPGYLVRNDQVLDPAVVGLGAERNMKFTVPEGVVDPITVGTIEADPYPTISGRVYKPAMPVDTVDIVPIDSPDLGVTMSCPGGTPFAAARLDDAGVQGATPPLYDSWVITKQQIDTANLEGDCTLDVQGGAAFASDTVPLPGVQASDGASSSDRRVHSVLGPPAPSIGGTVYWNNGLTDVAITGATISATRATDYSVVENSGDNVAPAPIPTPGSTSSGAGGVWDLDGQVIGVAPYVFSAPNFGDGTVSIRVDPTGAATATAGTGAAVAKQPDGTFRVRLSAPTPRTLTGVITLYTNGTPDFGALQITATRGAVTIDESTTGATTILRGTPSGNTLPFTINGAEPGEWAVQVNVPAGHVEFGNTIPAAQNVALGPLSPPVTGFNMSIAELADLKLTLVDGATPPADITTAPKVTLVPVDGIGPTKIVTATAVPGDPNSFTVENIEVNFTGDPATTAKPYKMTLELKGYDVTGVNAKVPGSVLPGTTVNVRAGATTELPLTLPKFGKITGEVEGFIGGPNELITLCDPQSPTYATCANGKITAVPVNVDGDPLVEGDANFGVAPQVTVTGNTYTISGPQGYYELTVTHPQYEPQTFTGSSVPLDNFVAPVPPAPAPPPPAPSIEPAVLRIVNDSTHTPSDFVLQIIRGKLSISVFRTLTPPLPATEPVPLPDGVTAQYRLFDSTGLVPVGPAQPITGGSVVVDNLLPGDYTLQIREFEAGYTWTDPVDLSKQVAFPVITGVRIQRATPPAVPPGLSTPTMTTVVAPLPPLRPAVTGYILGQNSDHRAVKLPSSGVTYAVTGTFTEPSIVINGTMSVPDTIQGNSTAVTNPTDPADVAAAADTGIVPYTFSNVPVGAHEATLAVTPAGAMTGYTLNGSATRSFPVADAGVVPGPDFIYTVDDVEFRIKFPTGYYPDISVMRLTSPGGQAVYGPDASTPTIATFDDDTDTLIFEGVAPELGDFKLDFADALHQAVDQRTVLVAPDLDGNSTLVSTYDLGTTPAGSNGRLQGSVTQRNTATDSTGLQAGASITITRTSGTGDCESPCNVPVTAGMTAYKIDLSPGSYSVVTAQPDFQSQTVNVTVTGGQFKNQDISISKLATFKFTISNEPLPTGTTVEFKDGAGTAYPGTAAAVSGGGTSYTFKVPAETPEGVQKNYKGTAVADGYKKQYLPNETDSYAPAIGSSRTVAPFALTARTFTVTVTDAVGGPAPAGTGVIAWFGGVAYPMPAGPFNFSSAVSPTMPLLGTGTAVADATGYRANSATIPEGGSPPSIPLFPQATVTGTITKPAGTAVLPTGTKVKATAPLMDPVEANVIVDSATGNGTYTLTGLDVGLTLGGIPEATTYTITYDIPGVGIGKSSTTVTSTTASTPAAILPDPQDIVVKFTVRGSDADGTVDVKFSGETKPITPSAAGTEVTFMADENETLLGYSVAGTGFITSSGTVSFAANRAPTNVPTVDMVVRSPISGVVHTNASPGVPVNNATVRICAALSTPTNCTPPLANFGSDGTGNDNSGGFSITIPNLLPATTYHVWATQGSDDGWLEVVVNENRSYSWTSGSTIVIS